MHTGLSAGAFATPPRNLSRPSRKRAQNAFRPARRPRPIGTDANITSGDVKHHLFLCQHHRAKCHYHHGHSRSRLRAQTTTHLTSQHLSHPSERRSRERRLHAVMSGSRARKAPRRWSPTPRGLPRLHGPGGAAPTKRRWDAHQSTRGGPPTPPDLRGGAGPPGKQLKQHPPFRAIWGPWRVCIGLFVG